MGKAPYMLLVSLRVIVVVATVAVASLLAEQSSPPNRQWPPEVQKVPDQSPPLPAEEALKSFYMPPGYRVELVASEPLIQEPVALDWDLQGRVWAVEMPGGSEEHTSELQSPCNL